MLETKTIGDLHKYCQSNHILFNLFSGKCIWGSHWSLTILGEGRIRTVKDLVNHGICDSSDLWLDDYFIHIKPDSFNNIEPICEWYSDDPRFIALREQYLAIGRRDRKRQEVLDNLGNKNMKTLPNLPIETSDALQPLRDFYKFA